MLKNKSLSQGHSLQLGLKISKQNRTLGFFLVFHNTVLIYNTRNRSNDTTKSHQERPNLMLLFSTVSQESRD